MMDGLRCTAAAGLVALALLGGCAVVRSPQGHAVAPVISGELLPSLEEQPADPSPAIALGRYAPDVTLTQVDGRLRSLHDWRGSIVLLNFWASWCAPCRQEMPLLQATYDAYAGDGMVVLAVNMGEEPQRVVDFVADLEITFPAFVDERSAAGTLYRVRGAPTTYFLDRDGIIRQRYVGPLTTSVLASILSGEFAYPNQ